MPQHIKPSPEKYCDFCGTRLERKRFASGRLEDLGVFNRRKYCDRACMAKGHDAKPMRPDVLPGSSRYHARKIVPPGPCQRCNKANAGDVHHRDGNPLNNSPDNLERICRSCHLKEHNPKGECTICGKPVKGYGYCNKHYQRYKKWGSPFAVKENQHTPVLLYED